MHGANEVVESLTRFHSAFYDALSIGFRLTEVPPENVESAMYVLFILSKIILIIMVFLLTRTLSNDVWFLVLFASFCTFKVSSLVGGVSLFMPLLTSNEVAVVLCMGALCFLFKERYTMFWLTLSLSIFVHPLVTFHLFLVVSLPIALTFYAHDEGLRLEWFKQAIKKLWSIVLFGIASLFYLGYFAPPSMSDVETQLFLAAKGNMAHISLLGEGLVAWIETSSLVLLVSLAYKHIGPTHRNCSLLMTSALAGSGFGLLLSFLAIASQSARLAQFQPMRIFLWVTLFCYILLILSAVQALRKSSTMGVILLAVLILTILQNNIWADAFTFIGISYFLLLGLRSKFKWLTQKLIEHLTFTTAGLLVIAMFVAWSLGPNQ